MFINGLVEEMKSKGLGMRIGGIYCGMTLYADDILLLADDGDELAAMLRC